MVVVGLVAGLRYGGLRLPELPTPVALQRLVRLGQQVAVGLRPLPRALTIGLVTALLPCGWLYAFVVIAAGTGSAAGGAAIMIACWLGTVPILFSLGAAVQALTGTVGRRLPLATAVLIVLLGLGTIAQRLALSGEAWTLPQDFTSVTETEQQLRVLQETTPPCCRQQD